MKKRLIAVVAAVAAIFPVAGSGTAHAAAAGALAFECTAKLSAFPTLAGSGTCDGTAVPALATGAITGVSSVGPFAITGAGSFSASFTYAEGCVQGEPPVIGTAQGTASVRGMTALHNGAVVKADIDISFQWTRAGLTAAVVITDGTISFSDGATVDLGTSAGTAAFAPLLGLDNTCPDGGYLEAVVTGAATLAGT